jgi:hypothetical protein
MSMKYWLSALLLFAASSAVYAEQSIQWHFLGEKKNNGISGLSGIDDEHFLVVHDRKKPQDPRLSELTWKKGEQPFLTHLDWCDSDKIPVDLEAITAVPQHEKDYLVLESRGKVTRIQFEDATTCTVTAQFTLPTATPDSNMEGLSLHCFGENCLLVWAERGNDKIPAKMSWARFDVNENKLDSSQVKSFDFKAPYPLTNLRSISELVMDSRGNVWVAASSDAGDDGPFQSAIYSLGTFSLQNNQFNWQVGKSIKPVAQFERDTVKIEGLFFTPNGLIMGAENENLGGKVAILPLK